MGLYLLATPIGNLKDITFRAIEVLKSADIILAEDTRRAKILLDRYGIDPRRLQSFHEHSDARKISWVIEQLKQDKQVALVTDAGTPGISDPGGKLVASLLVSGLLGTTSNQRPENQIRVIPIPGPSALATILSVLPWPAEPVLFLGYLPKKKGRKTMLAQIAQNAQIAQTVVIFESPFRIIRTLEELKNSLGDCQCVVGRELTKQFEDIFYGNLSGAIEHFATKQKGEFTVALRL